MKLTRSPILAGIPALLGVSFLIAANPAAGAQEGFGSSREVVRLERVVPPAAALGGVKFAVRSAGAEAGAPWSRRLEVELEKELAKRDAGLIAVPSAPQIVVELTVLRNRLTDQWESKPERERRQIGFDAKGKSLYQSIEVLAQFQVIAHDVAVSFAILQTSTGAILDSGTIEAPFEGRFRNGAKAPTAAALETEALGKVLDGIAKRVLWAREPIAVLLPAGRLESLAALAAAGEWGRYRDALAALAPSPDPREEAYRQYALATASEALAYAASSGAESLEHLQLAESQYQAAIAAHPGEKLFSRKSEAKAGTAAAAAPLERVRAALASFKSSEKAPPEVAPPAVASPAVAPPAGPAAGGGGGAMDNAAVIRMVREGEGGYAIMKAIKAAPEVAFDLSPEGLSQLAEAKVDPKIIGYMRQLSEQ